MSTIGLDEFGSALAALGALSVASFGLLDSSKALGGGVSNVGLRRIDEALKPFAPALAAAVGPGRWQDLVAANWRSGLPKVEQKAAVRALIKLGLTEETAPALAHGAHLDPKRLSEVAGKLATGEPLSEAELNLIGRLNAVLDAVLDCAFDRAESQYRLAARALSGAIAVGLAYAAWFLWPKGYVERPPAEYALVLGLLAAPLAPVAKDVANLISSALRSRAATVA